MKSLVRNLLLLALVACEKMSPGYRYERGSLPELPVNLSDFNTEYDDYNSTAPSLGELIPFCFSTNRNSRGQEFDVVFQPMNVNFDKSTGELKVTNEYANWMVRRDDYEIIKTGLGKIKTSGSELGPNLLTEYDLDSYNFTLLYSTDVTGNAQINFTSNRTDSEFSESAEVQFLNSEFNDMYPAFNAEQSAIYFCSDRREGFDIYFARVDPAMDTELLLADPSDHEIVIDTILSSRQDDKCPFIWEDKMVFTSDRDGGFGGFDLYYSIRENGKWGEPVNFGDRINTEFDEYRPVLIDEGVSWTQTMMVFSSNRPGGKGGFDLYFVGIENE